MERTGKKKLIGIFQWSLGNKARLPDVITKCVFKFHRISDVFNYEKVWTVLGLNLAYSFQNYYNVSRNSNIFKVMYL